MKIVVIGGRGRIGSMVVENLERDGHDVVAADLASGVNTLTGDGLAGALDGADVVVDVSNSPSFEDAAVLEFFQTSTGNILAAERDAGVGHHVALSVVGADRLPDSGYLRAKLAQERLIEASGIPYSIVRSTQFFEFARAIADDAVDRDAIRVPSARIQPIAAVEVARAVARVAAGVPVHGIVEIGGPEAFTFSELIDRALTDPRHVVADPGARYFGTTLADASLLPGPGARLGQIGLETWLSTLATHA
ncbi:MAG TPA: SDR family oxidoreductase [Solirubrobacter sp.]|nr:SDR family oxidoreductase [Solirubrobacter sp.]